MLTTSIKMLFGLSVPNKRTDWEGLKDEVRFVIWLGKSFTWSNVDIFYYIYIYTPFQNVQLCRSLNLNCTVYAALTV